MADSCTVAAAAVIEYECAEYTQKYTLIPFQYSPILTGFLQYSLFSSEWLATGTVETVLSIDAPTGVRGTAFDLSKNVDQKVGMGFLGMGRGRESP